MNYVEKNQNEPDLRELWSIREIPGTVKFRNLGGIPAAG